MSNFLTPRLLVPLAVILCFPAQAAPQDLDLDANLALVQTLIETRKREFEALAGKRQPPAPAIKDPTGEDVSRSLNQTAFTKLGQPGAVRDPFAQSPLMLAGEGFAENGDAQLPAMRIKAITMRQDVAFVLLEIENGGTVLLRSGESASVRSNTGMTTFRVKRIHAHSVELEAGNQKSLVLR